jgi:integrase
MATIRGTVFKRSNGTYTVQAQPTWDPRANRWRRPSLGTFKTREEAQDARLRYNVNQADGVFSLSEIDLRKVRLDEYLVEWLGLVELERLAGKIALQTQRDYEAVVRCHIVPHIGRRRIADLTPEMLNRWLLGNKIAGASDRTVQKAYRTLHRAFADCELRTNPAVLPKRYRPKVRDRKPRVYPTVKQVDEFVNHVAGCDEPHGRQYSMMWRLVATCGIRRGEACGLRWCDIDLKAHTISINKTIQVDRGSLYVKGPKSDNGYRIIGVDPDTVQQLHRHRQRMLEERAAAGASYQIEPLGHDFVFRADKSGAAVNPERITKAFTREWAHAGLPAGPTLHGLRHTNGSLLLLNGVAPIHVAAHLGHDLQTLNNVYAHELDPTNRQEVIAQAVANIYR